MPNTLSSKFSALKTLFRHIKSTKKAEPRWIYYFQRGSAACFWSTFRTIAETPKGASAAVFGRLSVDFPNMIHIFPKLIHPFCRLAVPLPPIIGKCHAGTLHR